MDAYCPTHGLVKAKVELGPKRSIKGMYCSCGLQASTNPHVNVIVVSDEVFDAVEDDSEAAEGTEEE